jgi:uroporphyrinogen decarboxylase
VNNRDRFLSAVKLKEPDRVPYFDYFDEISILNTAKVLFGDDMPEMKSMKTVVDHRLDDDTYKYHDLQFEIIKKMDIDAITAWALKSYERIPDKKDLVKDDYGIIWRLSEHGEPIPVEGPVKHESDLKKIATVKPDHSDFKLLRYFKEKVPERVLVFGLTDPFRLCWSLLGALEKLLPLYITNPDFCLKLTRIATDFVKQEFQLAIDLGAEVFILEADLAFTTGPFMSRDHYRRFVQPFHQEICEIAHKQDVPMIKHSDGNIWPIIDDLIEAGFDGFHPIEPQCMEITEVKSHLTGKACILGNIDCMHLLPFGTKEEVTASVKETIQKVAPGGGYILCSSNSIHPGCKGENVIAMFEAAKEYGAYPIIVN